MRLACSTALLKIEIVENAHTHRDQRQLMERNCDCRWQARWHDVVRSIAADEGNAALL